MAESLLQAERDRTAAAPRTHGERDRGLLLIAIFKLLKAIFFFLLGVGALHLVGRNLSQDVLRLASVLRRDSDGRMVHMVLERVGLIDVHRLRQISLGSFAYSALALTEGVGLYLEKVWAEYVTLMLTVSFLPWELFELVREPSWFPLALLVINLLVLLYLVWFIQRKRRHDVQG